MVKPILQEIAQVERQLKLKLRQLQGSDEEETKEHTLLQKKIHQIGVDLHDAAEKAKQEIERRLRKMCDPLLPIDSKIQQIEARIIALRADWRGLDKKEQTRKK